jgi:hypothetical protein
MPGQYSKEKVRSRKRVVFSIGILADLMLMRGTPSHIRSDNGTEFTTIKLREWLLEINE